MEVLQDDLSVCVPTKEYSCVSISAWWGGLVFFFLSWRRSMGLLRFSRGTLAQKEEIVSNSQPEEACWLDESCFFGIPPARSLQRKCLALASHPQRKAVIHLLVSTITLEAPQSSGHPLQWTLGFDNRAIPLSFPLFNA